MKRQRIGHTEILNKNLSILEHIVLVAQQGASVCNPLPGGWRKQADAVVVLYTTPCCHSLLDIVDFRIPGHSKSGGRL